jgi:hypothetical protein
LKNERLGKKGENWEARRLEGRKAIRVEGWEAVKQRGRKAVSWIAWSNRLHIRLGFSLDHMPQCPHESSISENHTFLFYVIKIDFGEGIEYFCSILNL